MNNFGCLVNQFQSTITKHSASFRTVAVLTQLSMSAGEPLMDVSDYNDTLSDAEIAEQFWNLT